MKNDQNYNKSVKRLFFLFLASIIFNGYYLTSCLRLKISLRDNAYALKALNSTMNIKDQLLKQLKNKSNNQIINIEKNSEKKLSDLDVLTKVIQSIDNNSIFKKELEIIRDNFVYIENLIPSQKPNKRIREDKYKSFGIQVYKITPTDFLEMENSAPKGIQSNLLNVFFNINQISRKNNTAAAECNYVTIISIGKAALQNNTSNRNNSNEHIKTAFNSSSNQTANKQKQKDDIKEYCILEKSCNNSAISADASEQLCEVLKRLAKEITNKKLSLIFENGIYLKFKVNEPSRSKSDDKENSNPSIKIIKQISVKIKNIFYNFLQKIAQETFKFPKLPEQIFTTFSHEAEIKQNMNSALQAEKACRESIIKHIDFSNVENVFGIFKNFKIYKTKIAELQQVSISDGKKSPGFFCTNGDYRKEYFVVYPSYKTTDLKAKKLDPQKYLKRLKIIAESRQAGEIIDKNDVKFDKDAILNKKEIAENLISVIKDAIKDKINTVLLN